MILVIILGIILYLILFGLGTVISMALITIVLSIPFTMSSGSQRLNTIVSGVAGAVSVVFGVALMSDVSFQTSLIPF